MKNIMNIMKKNMITSLLLVFSIFLIYIYFFALDLEITLAVFTVLAGVLGIIAIVMATIVYKHK